MTNKNKGRCLRNVHQAKVEGLRTTHQAEVERLRDLDMVYFSSSSQPLALTPSPRRSKRYTLWQDRTTLAKLPSGPSLAEELESLLVPCYNLSRPHPSYGTNGLVGPSRGLTPSSCNTPFPTTVPYPLLWWAHCVKRGVPQIQGLLSKTYDNISLFIISFNRITLFI